MQLSESKQSQWQRGKKKMWRGFMGCAVSKIVFRHLQYILENIDPMRLQFVVLYCDYIVETSVQVSHFKAQGLGICK